MLESVQKDEDQGDPFPDSVAKSFESIATQQIKKEDFEQIRSEYKVPSNCKALSVPKVNPEVWKNPSLPKGVKSHDLKLQLMQNNISQSLVALGQLASSLISNQKSIPKDIGKTMMKTVVDAGKLMGMSLRDLTSQRKIGFKSVFSDEASAVCFNVSTGSELLFGPDLEAQIKQSRSNSKMLKTETPRRFVRTTPYSTNLRMNQPTQRPGNLNWKTPPSPSRGRGGWNNKMNRRGSFLQK